MYFMKHGLVHSMLKSSHFILFYNAVLFPKQLISSAHDSVTVLQ